MHLEAITREFQLIEFSDEEVESPPARLLDVISRLRTNYDQLGFAGNRRFALEAIERGDATVDFELPVPVEAGSRGASADHHHGGDRRVVRAR